MSATKPSLGDLLMEVAKPQSTAWRAGYTAYSMGYLTNPYARAPGRGEWKRGFAHAKAVGAAAVAMIDEA